MNSNYSKTVKFIVSSISAAALSVSLQAIADTTELKLVVETAPKDSPEGESLRRWGELMKKYSNGNIEPKYFYQNELGSQQGVFDLLVAGEVDGALNYPMTTYSKKVGVIYTPYMFTEWEDAYEAYQQGGWLSEILRDLYKDINLKFLGPRVEGFTGITTRGAYATNREEASDLGFTLRTMPVFPIPQTVEAMGYNTAAIDWSETYTALQTGVVDGNSNNIIYWDYIYLGDVMDYFTQTNHFFMTAVYSMNNEVFENLSEENKEAVLKASEEMVRRQFKKAKEDDEYYRQQAINDGIEYIKLSESEMNDYAKHVRETVWPQLDSVFGEEIMKVVRENASSL
ncbi:MAG: TRAP transporter substrate-binding protein DctP [Halomonas sp.]|nr:TRAP transporter substrate-binding protein DctP [Halomonas sp.]